MTAPQNPRVTQADADVAQAIVSGVRGYGVTFASPLEHSASVMVARHREAAEAASKAREAALVEAAKVDAFNHGYLVAVSIMLHQHDDTVIAEDALRESGLRLPQAKALGLDEYDLQVLRPVFQEMERKDSLRRAAITKEPDA